MGEGVALAGMSRARSGMWRSPITRIRLAMVMFVIKSIGMPGK